MALGEYRKVLHLAELRDDPAGIATALLNLGTVQLVRGDLAEATLQFRQAERRFAVLGDDPSRLQARINLAIIQVRTGEVQKGVEALQQILGQPEADKRLPPMLQVVALNGLAGGLGDLRQYSQAHATLERADTLARESGIQRELASTRMNRARLQFKQGNLSQAKQALGQALEMDRSTENVLGIAADLHLLGVIADQEGEKEQARDHFRQAGSMFDYCGLEKNRIFSQEQRKYLESKPR
ncbi:MAG: tetratricopeptide repeat protein [Magnetococcus sp. YQC-3]